MQSTNNTLSSLWRTLGLALLVIALGAGLFSPAYVAAQGGTRRQLAVGDLVTGTLNANTVSQTYSLAASAGDSITIEVTTDNDALNPVVVVTDQRGNPIAQDLDVDTPTTATLADIEIPANGTYYITVLRGSGAEGDASGQFSLRLTGFQQVGGQTITLDQGGITFELNWSAPVDLNLEVRDPVGGTVHTFSPGAPSGGTLESDANTNCQNLVADTPTEVVSWPAGEVPAGSYEIIIYYVDGCEVNGPQVFDLTANVNGGTTQTITGTLNPSQRYLSRLELQPSGEWSLSNGGVNAGLLNVSLFRNQIANADPIAVGSTVSGLITNESPARAYTFDATAGTSVNVSLEAESGSLDTFVALLGPDDSVLVSNDDFGDSTNSSLERTLAVDGTYTVIATRYGLNIGGTEGEYTLALTSTAQALDTGNGGDTGDTGTGGTDAAVELPEGAIEVQLTWNTNADLQLQVRDPRGETVYDDVPIIQSGGILEEDGNVGCTNTTTEPVSYIYWPPNRLTPGTYEVEVWYQNTCNDNLPVTFALSVNVQDQTIINTTQAASPNSRYMITFNIAQDGTATAGPGGFFDMTTASTLNYQDLFNSDATIPITYGQTVSGSITGEQRFVMYEFEGQEGDIISILMEATGGTLDPALYLINSEGIQLNYNDDIAPQGENRNSAIQQEPLAFTGTYYIIATHYGLNVGGTQGTYELSLLQE
jgi:hypothetical protein